MKLVSTVEWLYSILILSLLIFSFMFFSTSSPISLFIIDLCQTFLLTLSLIWFIRIELDPEEFYISLYLENLILTCFRRWGLYILTFWHQTKSKDCCVSATKSSMMLEKEKICLGLNQDQRIVWIWNKCLYFKSIKIFNKIKI